MKLTVVAAIAASGLAVVNAALKPVVTQTHFIPLPEDLLLSEGFKKINTIAGTSENSYGERFPVGVIHNMISMTIAANKTVVFYDHWEDGYEIDHSNPTQSTTEIWGDGNASNGCAPGIPVCSDATDILKAGYPIVITQNVTTSDRSDSDIFYDGGDRIGTNYPVAMVRAAFPVCPGSLMAGAVELMDTDNWGTTYEAPLGTDLSVSTSAFQWVVLFVMSSSDNNVVTYQTGTSSFNTVTLHMGESITVPAKLGYTVTGTFPLQVDLITGDRGSTYEMRWYNLLPTTSWAFNYLSPLGDSKGKTKVIVYNPSPTSSLGLSYDYLDAQGSTITTTITVAPKKTGTTTTIPTGSACKLYSDNQLFTAMSYTDTEWTNSEGAETYGQAYDWGFPVMPLHLLTPQVIIGLGYGCTYNQCNPDTKKILSVVWITPASSCDVYVDYNNDGIPDRTFEMKALQGAILTDESDTDMSGAMIWATAKGSGVAGPPVKLAAAWGQNPAVVELTTDSQARSMDLGTVVVPFPLIRASKTVELSDDRDGDGLISPGDILQYIIRITNVGQLNIATGQIVIVDDALDSQLIYIPGTTMYNTQGASSLSIPDDTAGLTVFPLDEAGISNKYVLGKRGGQHEVTFKVEVVPRANIVRELLVNAGYIQYADQPQRPFKTVTPLNLPPITPTSVPTGTPTTAPTPQPTAKPTARPTRSPTAVPTFAPTAAPTSPKPTAIPTSKPTTLAPTMAPTEPPRYAPPGPMEEGLCPVPNTRPFLTPANKATTITHNLVGPGYKQPEQDTD